MNCQHPPFSIGDVIEFRGTGHCDGCSSVQNIEGILGSYIGDDWIGHTFAISPMFICPGCGSWIQRYHITCGNHFEVTEEFQTILAVKDKRL